MTWTALALFMAQAASPAPPTQVPLAPPAVRRDYVEPQVDAMRVRSMTTGATPAGMDGKAYSLFSPFWRTRWRTGEGAAAAMAMDEHDVLALAARLATEQLFRDVQVHLEFRVPPLEADEPVARAELLLHGCYGIVMTDSMNRPQRSNACGAISGQVAPDTSASFPPGAWQTLDIAFRAPRVNADGTLMQTPRVTVLHNGVLVQNGVDIASPTELDVPPVPPDRAPLVLVPRSGKMQLRNMWVRSLDAGTLSAAPPPPADAPAHPAAPAQPAAPAPAPAPAQPAAPAPHTA